MNDSLRITRTLACTALLALGAGQAMALYKVVGPDGRITYTDRPPAQATGAVSQVGRTAVADPATVATAALPTELRAVMARYPVVLYTGNQCPACDQARQWLQQRGVPYSERRASSEDDAQALERLVGARTIPSLTIGTQSLRGFSSNDWAAYVDAAGYPRDSRLPRGWQAPPVQPVVERAVAAPVAPPPPARAPNREAAASTAEPVAAPATDEDETPGRIRF
jgi:glutaredoxin